MQTVSVYFFVISAHYLKFSQKILRDKVHKIFRVGEKLGSVDYAETSILLL
jgi:hypothetical protein